MNVDYKNVRCMWWFSKWKKMFDCELDECLIVNWKGTIILCTEMNLIDCEMIRNCLTANWKKCLTVHWKKCLTETLKGNFNYKALCKWMERKIKWTKYWKESFQRNIWPKLLNGMYGMHVLRILSTFHDK